jgi:hypothetical protein
MTSAATIVPVADEMLALEPATRITEVTTPAADDAAIADPTREL